MPNRKDNLSESFTPARKFMMNQPSGRTIALHELSILIGPRWVLAG